MMYYFSCSGGTGTDSTKSALEHVMPNLRFSTYGIYGSRSAFRCLWGVKLQWNIFHARFGPV
jgi:hypothetical protein